MTWTLLAVHAHPDDESITMGGTLARYAAAGVRVVLVTATLGEEGEVIPAELAGLAATHADQLGGYRLAELAAACRSLGIADHRMLCGVGAFRDSGMAGTPSAEHPRAFVRARPGGPEHSRAVGALAEVMDEVRPDVVATYDADGGYGHPDHIAAHEITVAAASRSSSAPRVVAVVRPERAVTAALRGLEVPPGLRRADLSDLGFHLPDEAMDFEIPVDSPAGEAARVSALRAHRTQLSVFPGGFALTNSLAQPLLPVECFRLLSDPPGRSLSSRPAAELFDGLS